MDKNSLAAIEKETKLIIKNGTWYVIDRSSDKISITTRWILKTKRDTVGIIIKEKARLVARGFQ